MAVVVQDFEVGHGVVQQDPVVGHDLEKYDSVLECCKNAQSTVIRIINTHLKSYLISILNK